MQFTWANLNFTFTDFKIGKKYNRGICRYSLHVKDDDNMHFEFTFDDFMKIRAISADIQTRFGEYGEIVPGAPRGYTDFNRREFIKIVEIVDADTILIADYYNEPPGEPDWNVAEIICADELIGRRITDIFDKLANALTKFVGCDPRR